MSALLSEKIENPVHMFDKKVIAAAGDGCVQAKGKNCGLGIAATFFFFNQRHKLRIRMCWNLSCS
jgi:hypothetical protein